MLAYGLSQLVDDDEQKNYAINPFKLEDSRRATLNFVSFISLHGVLEQNLKLFRRISGHNPPYEGIRLVRERKRVDD